MELTLISKDVDIKFSKIQKQNISPIKRETIDIDIQISKIINNVAPKQEQPIAQIKSSCKDDNKEGKLLPIKNGKTRKLIKNSINLGGGLYKCSKCEKQFTSQPNKVPVTLKSHFRKYHNDKVINCNQCNYVTNEDFMIKQHIDRVHTGESLDCKQCGRRYDKHHKPDLRTHSSTIHENACHKCDKAFILNRELKLHIEVDHEGNEIKYKCEICNANFVNLKQHKQSSHQKRTNKCLSCNAEFKFKSYLLRHLRTHKITVRYY